MARRRTARNETDGLNAAEYLSTKLAEDRREHRW